VKTRVKTRDEILAIIRQNPTITRKELAQSLSMTVKGIDWNLKKLRHERVVKREGPDKGGFWVVVDYPENTTQETS